MSASEMKVLTPEEKLEELGLELPPFARHMEIM